MRVFNVGSPSFMAPEAYLRTLYSEKSESWSIAMILYFMLHGKLLD
jgi:serine/threonine protein kinase